ncbi:type II toxin-antitoxin system RelE/ParE family toxin [Okeania sp. KiyG1]|uniref:type II toxin-antitoxin system RelE/ParE family toxin n=1 Tax=Okeania sp. KiyG1 TaxID=2720165 RepID=UPI001924FB66|nr:type II toxin-antitoxin system RelE/ParE family toxin [Okeania sp. KiyG1]GGA23715.1 hypothetical protein CYANOKiyG1_39030 [Okeania sp. KiyG1]
MTWNWELYLDETEKIPKDLLAFFVRLIPEEEKSPDLPKPKLTEAETKRLQVNLKYLCDKGLASLSRDNFDKLEDDLYEFKLTKSKHNPRFILTTLTPQRFVILHAFKNKNNGAIKEKDKLIARQRLENLRNR